MSDAGSTDEELNEFLKEAHRRGRFMNPTQAENELAHWMKIANEGVQIELQLRKEMLTLEARTVEQCAKIAESYPFDGARFISDGKEIAAAIRAKLTEKK